MEQNEEVMAGSICFGVNCEVEYYSRFHRDRAWSGDQPHECSPAIRLGGPVGPYPVLRLAPVRRCLPSKSRRKSYQILRW